MKAASVNEIKKELEKRNHNQVLSYCLRMAKFKKESKELLSFLLFDADDIPGYIENIKSEMNELFGEINTSNIYYTKKSIRKILRLVNKYIRFIASSQAEAELLIHFCNNIRNFSIPVHKSNQLSNLFKNQVNKIDKALSLLHPDLQYDLRKQLLE